MVQENLSFSYFLPITLTYLYEKYYITKPKLIILLTKRNLSAQGLLYPEVILENAQQYGP